MLCVVGTGHDGLIVEHIVFDYDDLDAALTELDTRYLADEAAPHANTWSVITQAYAALNRHELPSAASDFVHDDHHRLRLWKDDLAANMLAAWEVMPDWRIQIVAVHRLTDVGALMTCVAHGTSQQGFDAEEPGIAMLMVQGRLINRFEYFDDADLDAAIARFDELGAPATQLENAATRGDAQAADAFNRRELDSYLAAFAANAQYDDRRKGLRNAGPIDRELTRGMLFTGALSWQVEIEPVGIRGRHLALTRHICRDNDEAERPVVAEVLALVEANEDELICRSVLFDPDDADAAFQELDALYLAGEAAAHAYTWSGITNAYATLNRRELPATTGDWVNIDHRRGASVAPGEVTAFLRAAMELTPQIQDSLSRLCIG